MATNETGQDRRHDRLRSALRAHPIHDIPPVGSRYAFGRVHRDRASLTGYRMELGKRIRAAALAVRGQRGAERRFVILSRPRSGSTLLTDLLRQIDGLRCDGEMLHFAVHRPALLLSALARTCVQPSYGCKVLSYQMFEIQRMQDPLAFLETLMADGFHLIHLRRNTFAQSMSLAKAQQVGQYTSWSDKTPAASDKLPGDIEIDEASFESQLTWNEAMLDFEDQLMSAVPHMRLQYEDDLNGSEAQQSTVDRICEMIGHPSGPVKARTRKTSGTAAPTQVRNYERLRALSDRLGLA